MSDKAITERLQPSLLDRLTDEDPGSKTESRNQRVIDIKELRLIIERDLSWLLNTNNNATLIDEDRFPNVRQSVVNFGVREVAGDFSTLDRAEMIRKSIHRAVDLFEPRIHKGSINVELRAGEQNRETVISFDIRADMWAQPMPLELYLRSEVDITTGELKLERIA
jgi:type VI secretion system protein ImpF